MNSSVDQQSRAKPGMNVFINSMFCERRELDTQKIYTYLRENNYTIVHDLKKANYIIFMTCGVTKDVANISFKSIEKYKGYDAEMIVAGCIPETHKEELEKIFTGKTISTKNLDKIDGLFPQASIKFQEIAEVNTRWENFNDRTLIGIVIRIHANVDVIRRVDSFILNTILTKVLGKNFFKTYPFNRLFLDSGKYYISISRGCIHNCTYCVIRKGVGRLHSKTPEQCVKEIQCGLQQGFRTFVMEADDLGPYGIDIGSSLPDLLRKIMEIDEQFTITIRHTHPMWIIKYGVELDDILKQKKVSSLIVSIQSGNDRILRLMGRPYSTEQLVDTLSKFKKSNPDLEIGVDLIVGFPSETEEEFYDTLRLFDSVRFDYGFIFPFSCHEGTKASTIEPKIPKQVIDQRMKVALRFLIKNNYFAWRFDTGEISFYAR